MNKTLFKLSFPECTEMGWHVFSYDSVEEEGVNNDSDNNEEPWEEEWCVYYQLAGLERRLVQTRIAMYRNLGLAY